MDYADYQHLTFDRRPSGVVLITINRPEVMNATNARLHWELTQVWLTIDADPAARVALVTGAGRAFSAGGDVKNMAAQTGRRTPNDVRRRIREGTGPLIMAIATIEKPVVAAVNGLAYGGGFSIAMACDIVYAARSARFAQAFVKRGLVPDTGSTWFLPRLIGPWRARELMFTGEPVDAERANALGLVNRVCDDATVLDEAIALAEKLAAGPTMAIGMIKTLVSEGMRGDLRQAIDAEADAQGIAMESEDFREGVAALLDKRDPTFQGR
jgi:2-(1,2-epoxy-1,2-dihydrophenyl)acetyl-CoA isomerase